MDKIKDVAKGGWHPPGKQGGTESWRGDFKGINQVVRLLRLRSSGAILMYCLMPRQDGWGKERAPAP